MVESILAAPMIATNAAPVLADSWNSDANISRAVNAAVETFKEKSATGLANRARSCHAGLDYNVKTNRNAGRDVEYCVALEFASTLIHKGVPDEKRQVI